MKWPYLALLPLLLGACASYQMGSTPKQTSLKAVKVIYVPTAQNETDETDLPGIMTNAILQEIDRDGTFRHARKDESDAILEVTIKKVERIAIRQSTAQFLTTLQFQLLVTVQYRLFNLKDKKDAIPNTTVIGTTTFFVQGDQTESQRQAYPLAAINAAQAMISSISNSGW